MKCCLILLLVSGKFPLLLTTLLLGAWGLSAVIPRQRARVLGAPRALGLYLLIWEKWRGNKSFGGGELELRGYTGIVVSCQGGRRHDLRNYIQSLKMGDFT